MFKDRFDAGKQLGQKLIDLKGAIDTTVLAIPCGGVPVGYQLARELSVPLDVMLSKKIGYPGNPDYTIGGVSLDNVIVDKRALEFSGAMEEYVKKEISHLRHELRKESAYYHAQRIPQRIENKTVILVDDGISTGKTMEITIDLIKKLQPSKLIIAVPVASKEAIQLIKRKVDEVICLLIPELFITKSNWYTQYDKIDADQVVELLESGY
jgi:predicted phosphoribosyltransferase